MCVPDNYSNAEWVGRTSESSAVRAMHSCIDFEKISDSYKYSFEPTIHHNTNKKTLKKDITVVRWTLFSTLIITKKKTFFYFFEHQIII